jgi:hypothetical protein
MRPDVLAEQVALTIRGLVAPLALRVAALEGRAPVPGPPGPVGPPGRDGADGKGLQYLGVYLPGKAYDIADLVTADGSVWYCTKATTSSPGGSSDWTLMVKHGRDLRDPQRGKQG